MGSNKKRHPSLSELRNVFPSPNADQEGVLLKAHLKRYWNLASPPNILTYNAMTSFFEFLKFRGEPITGWIVWAVLAYFQHKRPELLARYDIRVAKQNTLDRKIAIKPVEKSHLTNFMYSFKKFIRVTSLKMPRSGSNYARSRCRRLGNDLPAKTKTGGRNSYFGPW